MATRFYLSGTASDTTTPAIDGSWTGAVSGFARYPMDVAVSGTALADHLETFPGSLTAQYAWAQFLSSQVLNIDQTISGTLDICVGVQETVNTSNFYLALTLRVVKPDGTIRGTLLVQQTSTGGTEWGVTLRSRIWSALSLTSVAALAGDRLVLEIGAYGLLPVLDGTGLMRWGDPSGVSDITLASGQVASTNRPWFELSQTLTWGTPNSLAPTPAVASVAVPSPALSATLGLSATPSVASVAVPSPVASGTLALDAAPATASIAVPSPVVSATLGLAATPATAAPAVPSPALSATLDLAPTPSVASVAVPSPVASGTLALEATPASAAPIAPSPALSALLDLAPTPASASIAVPSPSLDATLNLQATPAAALATVPDPVASGSLDLVATPASADPVVPVPFMASGIVLAPTPAVVSPTVPSPDASGSLVLDTAPASALAAAPSPALSAVLSLAAAAAVVAIVVPPPTLQLQGGIEIVLLAEPALASPVVAPPVLDLVFSPSRSLDGARTARDLVLDRSEAPSGDEPRLARAVALDRWPPRTGLGS